MERPVGALRQSLTNGRGDPRGTSAHYNDFPAVLLLELQGAFQGVGVGLVHFVAEIVLFNPLTCRFDEQSRVVCRNLLDRNQDLHASPN